MKYSGIYAIILQWGGLASIRDVAEGEAPGLEYSFQKNTRCLENICFVFPEFKEIRSMWNAMWN